MWPFRTKEPKSAPRLPTAGDTWTRDKSPWPTKDAKCVKILDAKEGWVRYYMNPAFPDERMMLDMFTAIYRFLAEEPKQ